MNSSPNPVVGLSEHGIKETIQVLKDAKAISNVDTLDKSEIVIDELESRVLQRIKHSPLAKLLNKHFTKLRIVSSHKVNEATNKEPKE